jgi:dinuclear metal center YbgI/SA1388 family protein
MECKKVIEILEKQSPKSYACDWDNVGLLVGREDKEIQKIYIALDATDEAIEEAIANGADMLLTHHPMIFKGMKRVTQEDFIGRRIIRLIQNDMVYYAMHTNFDVMGMADLAADYLGISDTRVLEITSVSETGEEGIGRYGSLKKEMTVRECCEEVKQAFSLENVKVFGDLERKVKTAAISPGSGKSVISNALQAGVDVLITGDIDHHEGIDAVAQNMTVIDAGHYGVEHIFIPYMEQYLKREAKELEIAVQPLTFPFQII